MNLFLRKIIIKLKQKNIKESVVKCLTFIIKTFLLIEQAKIAASTINGLDLPHDQIPWFWSDQYNIKLKIAGVAAGYENYVVRRKIFSVLPKRGAPYCYRNYQ